MNVSEKKEVPKKKTKKKKNHWLRLLIKLGIIAAVIFVCSFFIKINFVHTNDMFPALRDGDLVIATNLISYSFDDVVLYRVEESSGTEKHIGRVMCLGNNTVEIDDYSNFKVNDSIITTNEFYQDYPKGTIKYPYSVEDNHYFLLQDYRLEVNDSRTYGGISKKDILGKVIFVFRIRGF